MVVRLLRTGGGRRMGDADAGLMRLWRCPGERHRVMTVRVTEIPSGRHRGRLPTEYHSDFSLHDVGCLPRLMPATERTESMDRMWGRARRYRSALSWLAFGV